MTIVTGTSGSILSGLTSSTTSTSSTDSSEAMGKTDFLKLLVTQMNNQNPLDPQDNSEFVAQLAQFSSVESLQNLNTSVDSIMSNYQSAQALQASSLVGRSVIAATSTAAVDTSAGFSGSVALPASSSDVAVAVYNAAGERVKNISLGQQASGNVDFTWDGTDDDGTVVTSGNFSFKATATINDVQTALTTYLPATVNSVTLGKDGGEMTLNLAGLGSVSLSQVQIIGQ